MIGRHKRPDDHAAHQERQVVINVLVPDGGADGSDREHIDRERNRVPERADRRPPIALPDVKPAKPAPQLSSLKPAPQIAGRSLPQESEDRRPYHQQVSKPSSFSASRQVSCRAASAFRDPNCHWPKFPCYRSPGERLSTRSLPKEKNHARRSTPRDIRPLRRGNQIRVE